MHKTTSDPNLSIIIYNVQSRKLVNQSGHLKSEFNKHFNRMKIKSFYKTQYGNIVVELTCPEDVEKVLQDWKPHFFTVNNSNSNNKTYVRQMTNSRQPKSVIIKHVLKDISEQHIENAFKEGNFTEVKVKRFIKNGQLLNTVKVTLSSTTDYQRALSTGIYIDHMHFSAEPMKYEKMPMQCFRCKRFGHPVKWCHRSMTTCNYCTEDHQENTCQVKEKPSEHRCRNCGGNHVSTSKMCNVFIEKLASIVLVLTIHNDYG